LKDTVPLALILFDAHHGGSCWSVYASCACVRARVRKKLCV